MSDLGPMKLISRGPRKIPLDLLGVAEMEGTMVQEVTWILRMEGIGE